MKRLLTWPLLAAAGAMALPVIIDSTLKGLALMLVACGGVLLLRKASAEARHLVWLLALSGLMVLPVLSVLLPEWRVLPAWLSPAETVTSTPSSMPHLAIPPVSGSLFAAPVLGTAADAAPTTLANASDAAISTVAVVALVWGTGVLLLALRLVVSRFCLRRSVRRARRLEDGPVAEEVRHLAARLGIRRRTVRLMAHEKAMPMTWGILRPCLMLPSDVATWSPERRCAVLLHELGHIRRWDAATHLFVQSVCALHWFNPFVWLAAWRIHAEREQACDDLVLRHGVRPSDYARHLLDVLAGCELRKRPAVTAVAMARSKGRLEGRVVSILNEKLNRRTMTRGMAVVALVAVSGLVLPIAMMRAEENEAGPEEKEEQAVTDPEASSEEPSASDLSEADPELIGRPAETDPDALLSAQPKPIFERTFLGGARNLRGFEYRNAEDAVAATESAGNAEPTEEAKEDGGKGNNNASKPTAEARKKIEDWIRQSPNLHYDEFVREQIAGDIGHIVRKYLEESPHPRALPAEFLRDSILAAAGNLPMSPAFSGVGIHIRPAAKGGLEVTGILPDGPAAKSGVLQAGDRIVGVAQGDDAPIIDVRQMDAQSIRQLIRGDAGTNVRIRLAPKDGGATREVVLKRARLPSATDPEIAKRIEQHEKAFQMQVRVPEVEKLRRDQAKVRADLEALKATGLGSKHPKIRSAEKQVERLQKMIEEKSPPDDPSAANQGITAVTAELAALRAEREVYRSLGYGDQHPKLRVLSAKVEQTEKMLKALAKQTFKEPADEGLAVPLKHSDVEAVANRMQSIAPGASFVADPRTNTLRILGEDPKSAALLKKIAESLDEYGAGKKRAF